MGHGDGDVQAEMAVNRQGLDIRIPGLAFPAFLDPDGGFDNVIHRFRVWGVGRY
jgi:hypothetical protein